MLLSLKPQYSDIQGLFSVFSNDYVIKMLALIFQKPDKCSSASELASILGIHVSTAKKHLELLHKFGFLTKKIANDRQGRPTYYTLKTDQVVILLDLKTLSGTVDYNISFPNVLIREKKGLYPRVQFIFGENKSIKSINIRKRTKAHRTRIQRLNLTDDESKFLEYLPHPTMEPCSLLELCERANITGLIRIRSIYNFVVKLQDLGILNCVEQTSK
ncbi:MAG: ArsR/SmtB family transcription factor [Candidatus Hodarchaeota archaeon]